MQLYFPISFYLPFLENVDFAQLLLISIGNRMRPSKIKDFGTSFQAITRFPFPFHQISSETEVRFHRDVRPSDVFAKFCSKSGDHETH